jgi:hypothetical protein
MAEGDGIVSDPEGFEELQVKAMAILIRSIVVCYELVTDDQVETLEEGFETLKRRITERVRADEAEDRLRGRRGGLRRPSRVL